MSKLVIDTPEWGLSFFQKCRYKGAYGGRGSGKSHFFAEMLIEEHIINKHLQSVCVREVQKSIKMSVKRLLEYVIEKHNLQKYFEVQDQMIKSRLGKGIIIFQGMQNHTAESIKSLEGFDRLWIEEAQSLSQRSLDLLRPTIRKKDSEIWATWNPYLPTDPIDVLLRGDNPPPNSIVIKVNYKDNEWFPEVLKTEMEYDKGVDYEKYEHIWLGDYLKNSEARVFKNWKVEEFETPADAILRHGADWGFSVDPTVLVRCFQIGRKLYVDYEAYQIGCEIDDIPNLFMTVPDSERWPIVADSARPETISYVKKHGFPKIMTAVKGAKSVEEGIAFLNTLEIIVHPRCVHTIDELENYKYKIDKDTGKILPILEDKNNHVMDALRYANEASRRAAKNLQKEIKSLPIENKW